ncbi:hypothetical protein [Photobacterium kishitanii]|nr:hypothetical protein [Photobacterium kishitanii]
MSALMLSFSAFSEDEGDDVFGKYEVIPSPDIGVEMLSFSMPNAVSYALFNPLLISAAKHAQNKLKSDGNLETMAARYKIEGANGGEILTPYSTYFGDNWKNTVLGKMGFKKKSSSGDDSVTDVKEGALAFIDSFSFEKGLYYFNSILWYAAGFFFGFSVFRIAWVMMSTEDNNKAWKKLIMIIPSLAIAYFAIRPTSIGLTFGQEFLVMAFLVSNFIASLVVRTTVLFLPFIDQSVSDRVESMVFQHGNTINKESDTVSNHLQGLLDQTKSMVNQSAADIVIDEMIIDYAYNARGLLLTFDDTPSSLASRMTRTSGDEDLSYAEVRGRFENAKAHNPAAHFLNVDNAAMCIGSSDWLFRGKSSIRKDCVELFKFAHIPNNNFDVTSELSVLKNAKEAGIASLSELDHSYKIAVEDRVAEMKELICSKIPEKHDRVTSSFCLNKRKSPIFSSFRGDTAPNSIKDIVNYTSFNKDNQLWKTVKSLYRKGAFVAYSTEKVANEKTVTIYDRGFLSLPYSVLTAMTKRHSSVTVLTNNSASGMSSAINKVAGGAVSKPNIEAFLDYINAAKSEFGCHYNDKFCGSGYVFSEDRFKDDSNYYSPYVNFDMYFSGIGALITKGSSNASSGDDRSILSFVMGKRKDSDMGACVKSFGRECQKFNGSTPFSKTKEMGSTYFIPAAYLYIATEVIDNVNRTLGLATPPQLLFLSNVLGLYTLLCVCLNYMGVFLFVAYSLRIFISCIIRLFVSLLAQPITAIIFLISGFSELKIDDENSTTSKTFVAAFIRSLVDCIALGVAMIVSLVLILVSQALISAMLSIFIFAFQSQGNFGGIGVAVGSLIFHLLLPLSMLWCIWMCSKLIPYLFEKLTDFVDDNSGVKTDLGNDLVTAFKTILIPSNLLPK